MGPQELFRTIKSIEQNCKEAKKTNPDLRYQVKLGPDNIELWTKLLREPQYTKQELTTYGPIIEPVIDKITTLPNFGLSPPKGRTFKRLRDSPDHSIITPKRRQYLNEEISLVPGWQTPNTPPFKSTIPSPPKESPQNKLVQIMKQMTKLPTPIKTRSRSKSGTKQQQTLINQKEIKNENSDKNQTKITPKQQHA